jgi:hypothetical protein
MHIDPYIDQVRSQLTAAAALGDERTQQVAATLASSAAAAVRLAIINALSEATGQVNAALLDTPGTGAATVSLQLDGDDVALSVRRMPADDSPMAAPEDGEATARISLRLTEQLKVDVERAATAESISVNTWLVRSARAGLSARRPTDPAGSKGTHRITGWVTG